MLDYVNGKRGGISAAFCATILSCLGTVAHAGDVVLKSPDDTIHLTGELIEATDEYFVVRSSLGPIRVAADRVDCFGDGCPSLAEGSPVVWDVSLWGKRRAFTEHVERLAELVDEKTDGEFTLNLSYGGLSKSRENLDGLSKGAFEMAQFCAGYHRDKNRSITVLELPFLGISTLEQEIAVSMAVYQHPATIADMARWNATLLMPSPLPQYNIMGTGFPPTSIADFREMTIRASGGIADTIDALGATVASVPAPEVRAALSEGAIDAVSFAPHAHMAFGTVEIGTWWTTNLNPGTVNCPVAINTDALEALPPAHRVALMSSVSEALDHYVDHYNGATMDAWLPALHERYIMELTIKDDILSVLSDAVAAPAAAEWIASANAFGLPGQELYDLVKATAVQEGS